MKGILFAEPMAVATASDCVFYHSMDLPISGSREGHWDLRGRFDDYISRISVDGKSVLDVGTASGIENPEPVSHWLARADRPENDYSFWHHSTGFYRELLAILGFELRSSESRKYRCNLEGPADGVGITTLVFKRRDASPKPVK